MTHDFNGWHVNHAEDMVEIQKSFIKKWEAAQKNAEKGRALLRIFESKLGNVRN